MNEENFDDDFVDVERNYENVEVKYLRRENMENTGVRARRMERKEER